MQFDLVANREPGKKRFETAVSGRERYGEKDMEVP